MTDLHIFLTKRSLYDRIKQVLDTRSKHNLLSGTLDGRENFYLHWMDAVPTEQGLHTLQQALGLNVEFIYLDEEYSKLKEWSALKIKTTWLNRDGELVHEKYPIHDAEIRQVEDVTHLAELLQKPQLQHCLGWWDEWDLPDNVCRHSATVSRIAYTLAVWMRNKGIEVDPILAHRGGLVHDLDKIKTLKVTGAHGRVGADFVEAQGYSQLAEIIRSHIMSTILEPNFSECSWELKLVYFADKLVEGDRLVPFDERLSQLFERYPGYRETMAQSEAPVWALSDQICAILELPDHASLIEELQAFL